MRRLFPGTIFLLSLLLSVLVVAPLGSYVYEHWYKAPTPVLIAFASDYWFWILPASICVLAMAALAYRDRRTWPLSQEFSLWSRSDRLAPRDLGFQVLDSGQAPQLNLRPHYPTYIARRATPHESAIGLDPGKVYSEDDLISAIQSGQGVLLIGAPLDGKTRTIFELVAHLKGYVVIIPHKDRSAPSEDVVRLLKRKKVILLINDLNDYLGSGLDLYQLQQTMTTFCRSCVVVATCRAGPELAAVSQAAAGTISRFYEDIPFKLSLVPITSDEKSRLSDSTGRTWDERQSALFPTPGSITMVESLSAMGRRFLNLSPEEQDLLRTLFLLASGGVVPFTLNRVKACLENIFRRTELVVEDLLSELEGQSFLMRSSTWERIQPEPGYLLGVITPATYPNRQQHMAQLGDVLEALEDHQGLFSLGVFYNFLMKDESQALGCYDRVLTLEPTFWVGWVMKGEALRALGRPEEAIISYDEFLRGQQNLPDLVVAEAWFGKGMSLHALGQHDAELETYDNALGLNPRHLSSLNQKAAALGHLDRHSEAVATLDQALEVNPYSAETWSNKGVTLREMGQDEQALEAFDKGLELNPVLVSLMTGKGWTLGKLGRFEEVQDLCEDASSKGFDLIHDWKHSIEYLHRGQDFDDQIFLCDLILRLVPDDIDILKSKADALNHLDRFEEEVQVYNIITVIEPASSDVWRNNADALVRLGRIDDAIGALNEALTLSPDDATLWHARGDLLHHIGRYEEALAALDQCLTFSPNDASTLHTKGTVLRHLGRFEDALSAIDASLNLSPPSAHAWYERGILLAVLNRHDEASNSYDEYLAHAPNDPMALIGKGLTLQQLGRLDEAYDFLCGAWKLKDRLAEDLVAIVQQTLREIGRGTDECEDV